MIAPDPSLLHGTLTLNLHQLEAQCERNGV